MAPINKIRTYGRANTSLVNNSLDAFNVLFSKKSNIVKRRKKKYILKELPLRSKCELDLLKDSLELSTNNTFDKLKQSIKVTNKTSSPASNKSKVGLRLKKEKVKNESNNSVSYNNNSNNTFNSAALIVSQNTYSSQIKTRNQRKNLESTNSLNLSQNIESSEESYLKRLQEPTASIDRIEESLEIEYVGREKQNIFLNSLEYSKIDPSSTNYINTSNSFNYSKFIALNVDHKLLPNCSTPVVKATKEPNANDINRTPKLKTNYVNLRNRKVFRTKEEEKKAKNVNKSCNIFVPSSTSFNNFGKQKNMTVSLDSLTSANNHNVSTNNQNQSSINKELIIKLERLPADLIISDINLEQPCNSLNSKNMNKELITRKETLDDEFVVNSHSFEKCENKEKNSISCEIIDANISDADFKKYENDTHEVIIKDLHVNIIESSVEKKICKEFQNNIIQKSFEEYDDLKDYSKNSTVISNESSPNCDETNEHFFIHDAIDFTENDNVREEQDFSDHRIIDFSDNEIDREEKIIKNLRVNISKKCIKEKIWEELQSNLTNAQSEEYDIQVVSNNSSIVTSNKSSVNCDDTNKLFTKYNAIDFTGNDSNQEEPDFSKQKTIDFSENENDPKEIIIKDLRVNISNSAFNNKTGKQMHYITKESLEEYDKKDYFNNSTDISNQINDSSYDTNQSVFEHKTDNDIFSRESLTKNSSNDLNVPSNKTNYVNDECNVLTKCDFEETHDNYIDSPREAEIENNLSLGKSVYVIESSYAETPCTMLNKKIDKKRVKSTDICEFTDKNNTVKNDVIHINDSLSSNIEKIAETSDIDISLSLSNRESFKISKSPFNIQLKTGKDWKRSLFIHKRQSGLGMFHGFSKDECCNTYFKKSCPSGKLCRIPVNGCKKRLSVRLLPIKPFSELQEEQTSILTQYALNPSYVSEQVIEESLQDSFRCLSLSQKNCLNTKSLLDQIPVTAREIVLRRCGQTEPLEFSKCFPDSILQHCHKIGEGVYGEVFLFRNPNGGTSVIKIVPVEGDLIVNGERQKKFEEVLSEIIITIELSQLRNNKRNGINAFTEVQKIQCIQGRYPEKLVFLWEEFADTRFSENDCPDVFGDDQLYIVFQMAYGGKDLESFEFNNAMQAYSMFQQVAIGLAVAEEELKFEHRDLHWGNVLISNVESNKITSFYLDNQNYEIQTRGVQVAIIDFTLSRVEHDGVVIFNDLALDPDLFTADGDYQFEIYRLMQQKNRNTWKNFEPFTNLLWLDYILDKAMTALRYKRTKTKIHKTYINKLEMLKEDILCYNDVKEFVVSKLLQI